ncbi:Uncharacterized protein BM_BM18169 [Brugia malayi]|uniref:Bm10706, isoform a n=2 Tax=Brugia TaxID=6278 RepID=A0A4E9F5F4_BRUMA|nr:Uncharacterized protein BM_BM18169 [Brugia malayi]VIO91154.1 Uncharacterized protein BM_BM18169 [Brugia malayi]
MNRNEKGPTTSEHRECVRGLLPYPSTSSPSPPPRPPPPPIPMPTPAPTEPSYNNPFCSLTSTQHFTTHPQLVVHMMRKDELDSDLNRSIKRGEGGSKGKRKGKNGPSSSIRSSTGPRRCHRQPLNLSVTVRTIFCSSFASAQLMAIFRPLAIKTCYV